MRRAQPDGSAPEGQQFCDWLESTAPTLGASAHEEVVLRDAEDSAFSHIESGLIVVVVQAQFTGNRTRGCGWVAGEQDVGMWPCPPSNSSEARAAKSGTGERLDDDVSDGPGDYLEERP